VQYFQLFGSVGGGGIHMVHVYAYILLVYAYFPTNWSFPPYKGSGLPENFSLEIQIGIDTM